MTQLQMIYSHWKTINSLLKVMENIMKYYYDKDKRIFKHTGEEEKEMFKKEYFTSP